MKKSIIAVLAVFLAAALFISAGSAIVIFPNTNLTGTGLEEGQTLYMIDSPNTVIKILGAGTNKVPYFSDSGLKAGTYSLDVGNKGTNYVVSYPDATVTIKLNGTNSNMNGKTVAKSSGLDFTFVKLNDKYTVVGYQFTTPAGGSTTFLGNNNSMKTINGVANPNWYDEKFVVNTLSEAKVAVGTWKVQPKVYGKYLNGAGTSFSDDNKTGSSVYTFTVGTTVDSITADKDSITRGNSLLVTVKGTPNEYAVIDINKKGLYLAPGQSDVEWKYIFNDTKDTTLMTNYSTKNFNGDMFNDDAVNWKKSPTAQVVVKIPGSGSKTIQFDTDSQSVEDTYKLTAKFYANNTTLGKWNITYLDSDKSVKVAVKKGAVTIESAESSYYIGNEIEVHGINTETPDVYLYIKGANKDLQEIPMGLDSYVTTVKDPIVVNSDNTWSKRFSIKNEFDAGTYTFYAAAENFTVKDDHTVITTEGGYKNATYATVALTLKQPFLTATAASNTIAKGDDIVISGQVEGTPDNLIYYVFGTNYFYYDKVSPEDDSTYEIKIETGKLDIATGQYFVVVQHPMYDKYFNVQPGDFTPSLVTAGKTNGLKTTIYSFATKTNGELDPEPRDTISDVKTRQSANAAQAVCVLIDEEYVDDIYVKLDFTVANAYLTINSVADQTQGATFTISGTTNVKVDETVTIDVVSTKFQAEPKASISAASYLVQSAKVVAGSNGVNTYSATFDGTPLAIDAYTAVATVTRSAATEDLKVSTTFNIVQGAVTPTATATGTAAPVTPSATATATQTPAKTPGFGALIALAGLGAVAVLVLRRQ